MRCGNKRERTIWQVVIIKKQMDISFSCICPVMDNEFCNTIVKVVCRSTWLSPLGSTATWTMLWWNLWSIIVNLLNITCSRKCLTTFPSTLKFDKDTLLCVVFSTHFLVFGNVIKYGLFVWYITLGFQAYMFIRRYHPYPFHSQEWLNYRFYPV